MLEVSLFNGSRQEHGRRLNGVCIIVKTLIDDINGC